MVFRIAEKVVEMVIFLLHQSVYISHNDDQSIIFPAK